MAQIIPFPANAEQPEQDDLLAHVQELHEQLTELDECEPEDMASAAYDRWAERHEALEDELDDLMELLDGE